MKRAEALLPGWALHIGVDREDIRRMLDGHLRIRRGGTSPRRRGARWLETAPNAIDWTT
jgi:hypothetical protein